jgi:sugar phosphate isomerase/epimerase
MIGNGAASPEEAQRAAGVRVRAVRAPSVRAARKLRALTLADCAKAKPRGYIIKNLIAPGDLVVLFGPPGSGKSVLAPFLAHAIATGRGIFGRRVRRAPVLYVAAEDGAGMMARAAALRQAHGDTPDLRVIAEQVDLQGDGEREPDDLAAIIEAAERTGAALVALDTLGRAFPGLDENDARSMGRAVRMLRRLCTDGRAVLVVHHGAKAGSSNGTGGATPRGHGVLNGDADVTLRVEVPEDGSAPRTVHLGKNRNGTTLAPLAFTIRAEVLGTDEDGDEITAPVCEEADADAERTPGRARLRPIQRTALGFLSDAIADAGEPLPAAWKMPAGLKAVPIARWAEECERRSLSTAEATKGRRDVFNRSAAALRDAGVVAMRDGWAWPT